jgi:hypothetical protein
VPRQKRAPPASPEWRKTSTNTLACRCSSALGDADSDTPTYAPTFAIMLQIIAWLIESRPLSPKSSSGFRSAMPNGPSSSRLTGSHPERAIAGSSNV